MYRIIQKRKGGTMYFSNFLFPHWEGQLCLSVTKFRNRRKAQSIARKIGGTVETIKEEK